MLPPGAAWTHLTGAALRGWALPDRVNLDLPLVASAGAPAPHLDRRGVCVRRCRLDAKDIDEVSGVLVASPQQLLRELAEDLSFVDLVVAMDAALYRRDMTSATLATVPRHGRRGSKVLRRAMLHTDGRSESAWETLLRLVHALSGLDDVQPQYVLPGTFDRDVGRADLWLRGTRRIHEYDGADHRDPARQRRDRARDNDLGRNGYNRRGYTRPDITRHAGRIVRDAEEAWALEHDPKRVQGWLREFRRSSYSAEGRFRLQQRLARFRRPTSPRGRPPRRPRVAQE